MYSLPTITPILGSITGLLPGVAQVGSPGTDTSVFGPISDILRSVGPVGPANTDTSTIAISWPDLLLVIALVGVAIAISMWYRIGLAKRFVIGAVRAVVQLLAVGYILVRLFFVDRWYWVMLALVVMLVAAAFTATDRIHVNRRSLLVISTAALSIGAGLTLAYVNEIVIGVEPWYNPRYIIPLFGMIVSNAMNGAALAAERLSSEIRSRAGEIEAYLALGASPARATQSAVRAALTAALIPAANGLAIVGIVSLPGMMTGQILAGASPVLAVRYQIVVMFMLTAAVAMTSALVVVWYRRTFFTDAEQLRQSL